MKIIILCTIIFFIFFLRNRKEKKGIQNTSSFVLFIYLLSLFFSIIYVWTGGETLINDSHYIVPSLVSVFLWILLLLPYSSYNESKIRTIILPNESVLRLVTNCFIVLSIIAIWIDFPSLSNILYYGSLGDARADMVNGVANFYESGVAHTFSGIVSSFYIIVIFLFFISVIRGNKGRSILLFISSFSYMIHVFSCVGRDGVVFWAFGFIGCFLFFYHFLAARQRKIIIRSIILFVLIVSVPFLLITFSRFGEDSRSSLISYLGQSFVHCSYFIGADNWPYFRGYVFPIFYELFGVPVHSDYWTVPGLTSTSFATFIVELFVSQGILGFCVFVIIWFILFKITVKNGDDQFRFSQVFIYLMYFQILSQGIFYFKQGGRGGNIYIIFSILLFILFKYIEKSDSNYQVINSIEEHG